MMFRHVHVSKPTLGAMTQAMSMPTNYYRHFRNGTRVSHIIERGNVSRHSFMTLPARIRSEVTPDGPTLIVKKTTTYVSAKLVRDFRVVSKIIECDIPFIFRSWSQKSRRLSPCIVVKALQADLKVREACSFFFSFFAGK